MEFLRKSRDENIANDLSPASSLCMNMPIPTNELEELVLAGNRRAIARLISRAEAGHSDCRRTLARIYRNAGQAHVIGITGVPGSGKSTLVRSFAHAVRRQGRTVAVVAIDPSSPFSGGAILGDRIRMLELVNDPGVFIRSMATRGALGGLARAALDAVDILDASGFDLILIETVGVGQDEVDIVQAAHSTVVVSAPGLGDDVQAIKAGILEIADIHVVNKADRRDANKTVVDLTQMLSTGVPVVSDNAWVTPVLAVSAQNDDGVTDLQASLDKHRAFLQESGNMSKRIRRIAAYRILKIAEDSVREGLSVEQGNKMKTLLDRVAAREVDPHSAAAELLTSINTNVLG